MSNFKDAEIHSEVVHFAECPECGQNHSKDEIGMEGDIMCEDCGEIFSFDFNGAS